MDPDAIEAYVKQCQRLIEAAPQMDEENTKVKLIQPFLELLGWDLYTTEVALEYTIPMASRTTHVDYALLVGDTPAVFVEAKPIRSTLTADDIQQLRSYMRQELDVDWGVLTNGTSFEVLTTNRRRNGGAEVSVVQFDLDDLVENPDVLELLTKESIQSGKSDEIADQIAETSHAINTLQRNQEEIATRVTTSIEREIGEIPIDLEDQSQDFIETLISVLRKQRQFVSDTSLEPSAEATNNHSNGVQSDTSSSGESHNTGDGYIVKFSDGSEIPASPDTCHASQKQNMGSAIDYLVEQHDLIEQIEVPHFPPKARTNCSINAEPVHPNGEEMRNPYHLVNGYYLHTSLNTRGKQTRIQDLAEQVGLSVEFRGEW